MSLLNKLLKGYNEKFDKNEEEIKCDQKIKFSLDKITGIKSIEPSIEEKEDIDLLENCQINKKPLVNILKIQDVQTATKIFMYRELELKYKLEQFKYLIESFKYHSLCLNIITYKYIPNKRVDKYHDIMKVKQNNNLLKKDLEKYVIDIENEKNELNQLRKIKEELQFLFEERDKYYKTHPPEK